MSLKKLLLEAVSSKREEKIKEILRAIDKSDTSHDFGSSRDFIDDSYAKIVSTDPTKHGEYLTWITKTIYNQAKSYKTYIKSDFKTILREDGAKIRKYLKVFDYLKKRDMIEEKDINQYKSVPELYDVVKEHLDSGLLTNKEQVKKETEVVYSDNNWMVVIPKSHEASCFWSSRTNWCTGIDDDPQTYEVYSKDNPLFIIMEKEEKGRKFQFHHGQTFQFMNEKDQNGMDEFWSLVTEEKFIEIINAIMAHGEDKLDIFMLDYVKTISNKILILPWTTFLNDDITTILKDLMYDLVERRGNEDSLLITILKDGIKIQERKPDHEKKSEHFIIWIFNMVPDITSILNNYGDKQLMNKLNIEINKHFKI